MSQDSMVAAASVEAHRARAAIKLSEDAGDILRGRIAANVMALTEHEGHSAALNYVNQLLARCVVPEEGRKLTLVVSNTAEIIGGEA